jgi:hypothetical protein
MPPKSSRPPVIVHPKLGESCSATSPCQAPFLCGPLSKTCVRRGSDEARAALLKVYREIDRAKRGESCAEKPCKRNLTCDNATQTCLSKPKKTPKKTPKVPTPKVPTPKVPTPKVPTPKVPTPKVPTPKVPTPKVLTPKTSRVGDGQVRKALSGRGQIRPALPDRSQSPISSPHTPLYSPAYTPLSTPAAPVRVPQRPEWDMSWQQGTKGFNDRASKAMIAHGLVFKKTDLTCPTPSGVEGEKPRYLPSPPQRVVQYLIHPETSVDRLLVIHRTGLGKTYAMLLALDNFYEDPRAKVLIFPQTKQEKKVEENFYKELMKFPNRYQDYATAITGVSVNAKGEFVDSVTGKVAAGGFAKVREALEMKGLFRMGKVAKAGQLVPGSRTVRYPGGPLRALKYGAAGGAQVLKRKGGKNSTEAVWSEPKNALFKGWDGVNPYSNCVVMMDEFHNLMYPPKGDSRESGEDSIRRLGELKLALMHSRNSVVVGLTATPLVEGKEDLETILAIIRGERYKNAPTNEGFVSYFQELPEEVFAKVLTGKPPQKFAKINHVEIDDEEINQMKIYLKKNKALLTKYPGKTKEDLEKIMIELHPYSTTGLHWVGNPGGYEPSTKSYERLMEEYQDTAVKLEAVVDDIFNTPVKTLVMISSFSGFKQLKALFYMKARARHGVNCPQACWITSERPLSTLSAAQLRTRKELIEREQGLYNAKDNLDGSKIQVMIVDSEAYEAGVSFFGVRRLVLVDVPMSWASYMQRLGRVLRFCGHNGLPPSDRTVKLEMYVTTSELVAATTDQYFLKRIKDKNTEMLMTMTKMRNMAVDRTLMTPWGPRELPSNIHEVIDMVLPMDQDSRAVRSLEATTAIGHT